MKSVALISSVFILTVFTLAAPPKVIEDLTGKVIGVTDGDTITVLVNRMPVKIRLEGVDAPEAKQSFGNKSKQALSELVFGKNVVVKKTGEDRYERTLGVIMLGSVDVNARMVEYGWAWHYKKYNDEVRLAKLEDKARSAKRGLWADPNSIAPWDFRVRQKSSNSDQPATMFWLNTSPNVRHNERCVYFKNTKRGRSCDRSDGKACGICGG